MSNVFHNRKWSKDEEISLQEPKRISTPAGLRLSVILNESKAYNPSPIKEVPSNQYLPSPVENLPTLHSYFDNPISPLVPVRSTIRTVVEEKEEDTESLANTDAHSFSKQPISTPDSTKSPVLPTSVAYAESVYSQPSFIRRATEELKKEKSTNPENSQRRFLFGDTFKDKRKRKWCIVIAAGILVIILALAIGLGVGLSSSSKSSHPSDLHSATTSSSPSSSPSSEVPVVNLPLDFPQGSYKIPTFLDTVLTNCTSNTLSWTCAPGITYYNSPSGSNQDFSFTITGSVGSYTIRPSSTSTDNDNDNNNNSSSSSNNGTPLFLPTALRLANAGTTAEAYRFQTTISKRVTLPLDTNGPATCWFNGTTFTGQLFTRTAKTYPQRVTGQDAAADGAWPFAVKLEEVAAGGDTAGGTQTPVCYGADGADVSAEWNQEPAQHSCSCLYRNMVTPVQST